MILSMRLEEACRRGAPAATMYMGLRLEKPGMNHWDVAKTHRSIVDDAEV